jgi:hypothetical protein
LVQWLPYSLLDSFAVIEGSQLFVDARTKLRNLNESEIGISGITLQIRSSSKIFPVSVPLRGSVQMNASRSGSLLVGRLVRMGRNSATGTPRDSIT